MVFNFVFTYVYTLALTLFFFIVTFIVIQFSGENDEPFDVMRMV